MSDSTPERAFPPKLPPLAPSAPALVPHGGDGPLGKLEPVYMVAAKPKSGKKAPDNAKFAAQRVALFAKEQVECPVAYEKIEAKRVTDDTYRINFLAVDVGQNDTAKSGFGVTKGTGLKDKGGDLVIKTWLRVHSRLVKVRWGKETVILSALSDDLAE